MTTLYDYPSDEEFDRRDWQAMINATKHATTPTGWLLAAYEYQVSAGRVKGVNCARGVAELMEQPNDAFDWGGAVRWSPKFDNGSLEHICDTEGNDVT